MKIVLALVIAVVFNVALYFYLQAQPSPDVAEAPVKNSDKIVVHTP